MLRRTCRRLSDEVGLDLADHIGTITLNRPAARNALSRTFREELEARLRYCTDPHHAVRAVVLQSAVPKVFCAGADLKERKGMTQDEAREFVDHLRMTFDLFEDLPIPTICAIEGAALGGGLELALAADIRIGGAKATFGVPETSLAIIPGAGGTYRLPKLVGLSHAKMMAFTGLPLTAEEAARIGLINRCVPEGEALKVAQEMARKISSNGPIAVKAAKQAMNASWGKNRIDGLTIEREGYDLVIPTKDRLEGLQAFAEKRKPSYKGE
jgi:methylglutaconyl-CoA hydratase